MLQIMLTNKKYRTFIKYAMKTCDSFSLVFEKDHLKMTKYAMQETYDIIKDFVLYEKNIVYHPDTGTSFQNSNIIFFECNKYTQNVLQKVNSVFDWNGQNLPEELCFYRNNKKWFVCVCHEKYLFIHNETEADKSFLQEEKIEFFYSF